MSKKIIMAVYADVWDSVVEESYRKVIEDMIAKLKSTINVDVDIRSHQIED